MCPPQEKVKKKGASKFVISIKREPSMWEHVDEMNTMIGSSRTLSVAHKLAMKTRRQKWIIM